MSDKIDGWENIGGDVNHARRVNADGEVWVLDRNGISVWDGAYPVAPLELPLPVLRALLAEQGLHIVGEADMAVLRACAQLTQSQIRRGSEMQGRDWSPWTRISETELSRRAAQKGTGT